MGIKVGINGFGRIDRLAIRAGMQQGGFEFMGINDHKAPKQLAYLFKYDTVFGRYRGTVEYSFVIRTDCFFDFGIFNVVNFDVQKSF